MIYVDKFLVLRKVHFLLLKVLAVHVHLLRAYGDCLGAFTQITNLKHIMITYLEHSSLRTNSCAYTSLMN